MRGLARLWVVGQHMRVGQGEGQVLGTASRGGEL